MFKNSGTAIATAALIIPLVVSCGQSSQTNSISSSHTEYSAASDQVSDVALIDPQHVFFSAPISSFSSYSYTTKYVTDDPEARWDDSQRDETRVGKLAGATQSQYGIHSYHFKSGYKNSEYDTDSTLLVNLETGEIHHTERNIYRADGRIEVKFDKTWTHPERGGDFTAYRDAVVTAETQYRYFHGLKTGINIPEAVKGTYNFLAALRKDMEGESIHKLGLAVGGIYIDGYKQVFTVHFGNPNHPSSSSIELKPLDRDSGLLIAKKSDTYGLNPVEYSLDLSTNELSIKKKIGDSTESTVRKPGFEGGNDGLYSEALRELISILNDVEKGNIQPPYFNDSPAYKLAANQINEYLGILLNYGKQIELPLYYAYPIVAYESAPFGKAHDQNSNHPSGENVIIFTARGHKTLKTVVYEAYGEKPVSYALDLETGNIRTKKVEAPQVELINDLMPPRQGGDRATYIAAIDAMIKTVDFVAEPKLETVAAYLASIRREILDSSL